MNSNPVDKKKEIINAFQRGESYAGIGRNHGISRQRVYQIIKFSHHKPFELADIFLSILSRDGYQCQWQASKCVSNREVRDLLVHHIDSNPSNNELNNLITLCKKCHIRFHAQEKKGKNKFGKEWVTY